MACPMSGPGIGSNTGMDTAHTIDHRLTELEIKSSYAEDLLDTLNQTIFRQQEQIEMLIREVRELRQQGTAAPGQSHLREDLPPHY
jgi:SlyX protein